MLVTEVTVENDPPMPCPCCQGIMPSGWMKVQAGGRNYCSPACAIQGASGLSAQRKAEIRTVRETKSAAQGARKYAGADDVNIQGAALNPDGSPVQPPAPAAEPAAANPAASPAPDAAPKVKVPISNAALLAMWMETCIEVRNALPHYKVNTEGIWWDDEAGSTHLIPWGEVLMDVAKMRLEGVA